MAYTLKENEKFVMDNIARFETSSYVQKEFEDRGIHVDINKEASRKTVEKYYTIHVDGEDVPMVYGENFEKTYHIYTDGRLNITATSMNDGSNFYVFIIHGNGCRIRKVA